jgi:hypothetical protein
MIYSSLLIIIMSIYKYISFEIYSMMLYILSHGKMAADGHVRKLLWYNLRYSPDICLQELRNTPTGIPTQIEARHLLLGPTCWTSLQSFVVIVLRLRNPKSI